jgi:hypothetical protein
MAAALASEPKSRKAERMACICCSVKVVSRYMGASIPARFVTRNWTLTGKMLDCETLLDVSGFGKGGMLWETG